MDIASKGPDIAFVVATTSRFIEKPRIHRMDAARCVKELLVLDFIKGYSMTSYNRLVAMLVMVEVMIQNNLYLVTCSVFSST